MTNIGIFTEDEYKNRFRVNNAVAFANPANAGLEKTITTLTCQRKQLPPIRSISRLPPRKA